ncbi:hypothetical protein C0Q70_05839 [Pomacea canaliculata]|uniref:Uncharacterized protein n=1 Tax=Pomacea canaliculata TaxID=400727 RepID=A0A2T7PMB9_POMCA|nr:hypothetical protein C0Q70_05839 [Pomacea canaliculata]
MILRAVHGSSTTPTPPSTLPPTQTPTPAPTPTTLTSTETSSSNSTSPTTTTAVRKFVSGIPSTNGTATSPASDSSSATPTTLTPSSDTIIATATPSTTDPTNTKSGLNQQEEIAIISFAVLAITALIVAFVAIFSVRLNRAREKPQPTQIEMRHMNGNPTMPRGYSPSEYSSRISDGNASGSQRNVSFSVEPLVDS